MKIYVASSWRNPVQPHVVALLKADGHEVYDFRHPEPGNDGFKWSDVGIGWQDWDAETYRRQLQHPIAQDGFNLDKAALDNADACVLVMPCGRSAHLEAGYAIGTGKPTAILLTDGEPELMYLMANKLCLSYDELLDWAQRTGAADA